MHPRIVLFIGNFFFSIFVALTVYILLPFLSSFMSETYAGLVIACSGLIAAVLFPLLPKLVARYGAQRLALVFALTEMVALFALAALPGALAAVFLAVITMTLQPFISYQLDILLEAITLEKSVVARVRTIFLTAYNFGSLSAPLLLGIILDGSSEYNRAFLVGAVALIPFIVLLVAQKLPKGVGPAPTHMQDTFVCIARDPDLGAVTFAHFLLYLFTVWAPFYVPIYLHDVLDIPWSTLGWMFSAMLIPYVLVEYPAGWIADRYFGDKELLLVGFLLSGAALASFSLISATTPLLVILLVLIISRVGAALIESMTEGHFFRRVSEEDINSISVFRGIWPLANFVGPVVASLMLYFGNFPLFFVCTGGFILIAGTITTLRLHDYQ